MDGQLIRSEWLEVVWRYRKSRPCFRNLEWASNLPFPSGFTADGVDHSSSNAQ